MELESTAALLVGQCKWREEGTAIGFSGFPGAVRAVVLTRRLRVAVAAAPARIGGRVHAVVGPHL